MLCRVDPVVSRAHDVVRWCAGRGVELFRVVLSRGAGKRANPSSQLFQRHSWLPAWLPLTIQAADNSALQRAHEQLTQADSEALSTRRLGKSENRGLAFCRVSIIAFHYRRGRCLECTARSLANLEARHPAELAMCRVWERTGRMARLARTCAEPMTGAQPPRSGEHGVLRHERSHHRQEACTAPRCVLVAPQRSDVSAVARCAMRGQRYLAERLARFLASTAPET